MTTTLCPLTFDDATHAYRLNGIPVPSVTQVLRASGYVSFYQDLTDQIADGTRSPADGVLALVSRGRRLAEARDRGQRVHTALHLLLEGDLDDDSIDDESAATWSRGRRISRRTSGRSTERRCPCGRSGTGMPVRSISWLSTRTVGCSSGISRAGSRTWSRPTSSWPPISVPSSRWVRRRGARRRTARPRSIGPAPVDPAVQRRPHRARVALLRPTRLPEISRSARAGPRPGAATKPDHRMG